MAKVELLKVFLASPGDVAPEREIVAEVLESVNRTMGREREVLFDLIRWDTDSFPAYGRDAQSVVNNQLADMSQYDLFVGIMWNRFGTPTPRAGSGTEEEFRRAVESYREKGRPAIMFYFNQKPFNPTNAAEAAHKLKVLSFKEEIDQESLTATYNGHEEFRALFQQHVQTWLIQYSAASLRPPHMEASSPARQGAALPDQERVRPTPEVISNSGMWVFLKTQFSIASEVSEVGGRKIFLKIPVTEAAEDAFFRSLQPSQYGWPEPVPFAHQNIGGIAKVVDVKRMSKGDTAVWELVIELDQLRSGFGMEMAYGNISADELAAMRARYILLNEKPVRPGRANRSNALEDEMFGVFVEGMFSKIKVQGSILPSIWKEFKGDRSRFLPVARLWSVFQLITSNTCEYILDLTLGPIKDGVMHVRFRGQRRKEYTNRDPHVIEFEGDCDLNAE